MEITIGEAALSRNMPEIPIRRCLILRQCRSLTGETMGALQLLSILQVIEMLRQYESPSMSSRFEALRFRRVKTDQAQ